MEQHVDRAGGHSERPAEAQNSRPWLLKRLYNWTISWAETPYAAWALFLLAVAEASFFPIPPDVLLIAMAIGAPRKSLRYAAICTAGSVLGGCLGYAIGTLLFETVAVPIIDFYHAWETFTWFGDLLKERDFGWILFAALTPFPYKFFTIAAGVWGVNMGVLLAASLVGRGLRFFAQGLLLRIFGRPVKKFIDKYFNWLTLAFFILLVLGFVCAKILWQNNKHYALGGKSGEPAGEKREPTEKEPTGPTGGARAMLSEEAQQKLLDVARQMVEAVVSGRQPPQMQVDHPELQKEQGAFVTLKTDGRLRGCIGRFVAQKPLWQVVRDMAVAAAAQDPRFAGNRIQPDELPRLDVEVSVLSPLEKIDNPLDIELGTHGIYIKKGVRTGCFLPQVATETGWDKEQFLGKCCSGKAGLAPDAWKDPDTEVYVFTAQVIGQSEG